MTDLSDTFKEEIEPDKSINLFYGLKGSPMSFVKGNHATDDFYLIHNDAFVRLADFKHYSIKYTNDMDWLLPDGMIGLGPRPRIQ